MEKKKSLVWRFAAFFVRDFHWKLLSLLLAFILWFVGTNVTNPVDIVSYDHITLIVLHRDRLAHNNLVLLNESEINATRISASIQATRADHMLIQAARAENIRASIDLSAINIEHILDADEPITVTLDVNLFIHQSFISRTMYPSTVELVLDRHDVKTMPISVDTIGTPLEGFESQRPQLAHRLVRLTGARSLLDEVSDVRARVYIGDAYETVEELESLILYNSRREVITDTVGMNIREVHIQVPIMPYADIPLRIAPVGSPRPGFMATEINVSPPTVSMVGSPDIIDETMYLILGEVDLTMMNETTEYTFDIRQATLGKNLHLRAGEPTEATVTIVVERVISREFVVPLENIDVSGYARPFSFVNEEPLVLTMRGRESVVSALNLGQISTSVDLTGLGAGAHMVEVSVATTVRGVALANLATVEISIEPEPIVFQPEEPPDWTADLDGEETEDDTEPEEEDEDEEEVLD